MNRGSYSAKSQRSQNLKILPRNFETSWTCHPRQWALLFCQVLTLVFFSFGRGWGSWRDDFFSKGSFLIWPINAEMHKNTWWCHWRLPSSPWLQLNWNIHSWPDPHFSSIFHNQKNRSKGILEQMWPAWLDHLCLHCMGAVWPCRSSGHTAQVCACDTNRFLVIAKERSSGSSCWPQQFVWNSSEGSLS